MLGEIVGLEQISITLAFLGVMIAILLFLRRKGGAIRSSLHAGKRIHVIEETAVAPGERLRLITIDDQKFVMISTKGVASSILPIQQPQPSSSVAGLSPAFAGALEAAPALNEAYDDGHPVDLTDHVEAQAPAASTMVSHNQDKQSEQEKAQGIDPQMSDFAVTFKRWRQQR